MPRQSSRCEHAKLTFACSSNASEAGFERQTLAQRIAAATSQVIKKAPGIDDENSSTFPAPLVLPEDELSWDPNDSPQSLRSWIREKHRNKVTPKRRTLYFVGPLDFEPGLEFAQKWAEPRHSPNVKEKAVPFPDTEDVREYLEAFYHGLPVKMLPSPRAYFTADIENGVTSAPPGSKKGTKSRPPVERSPTLWLNTHKPASCIGIRTRPTPDGAFTHQLNLNDLLDAAIEILPSDAYALLMMVKHDIYEDEEDDFACGRAYGGSRIAVVSGARYNPILDDEQRVPREHAWPASHCESYMKECCEAADDEDGPRKKKAKVAKKANKVPQVKEETPMHAALSAHMSLPPIDHSPSAAALSDLWLGRVCRTGGHELGHCFGIAHCDYYACSMQGTASIIEDARQPPYLCPVDLAKVLQATGVDEKERYRVLIAYCDKRKDGHIFAAFAAWMRGRIGAGKEEAEVIVIDSD